MVVRAKKRRPRAYHHGDARAALLTAALRLIERDGTASFSLREAAREVGVDPATSYRHFADRQGVLIALGQRGFQELAERFEEAKAETKGTPAERLEAMGEAYLRFAFARAAEFRIMFGESGLHSRDARMRPPDLERSPFELLEDVCHAVVEPLGGKPSATELATRAWAIAHGVARLAMDGAVPMSTEEAINLLSSVLKPYLSGLKTPSGRGASRA